MNARRIRVPTLKLLGSMPAAASLYDALGVPTTASESDIKRAFRQLALKWHPDSVRNLEQITRFGLEILEVDVGLLEQVADLLDIVLLDGL